ncbi:hypothetical protein [Hydrogenophaga sp. BPS33]|uniref:hypothetical protein n=1 Tax=Hydrogenophaga sp. BPS33 TaxID=2651974 RepID=UPI00131F8564|nr:hypothetical protein [Hydrogenophaga sp. BPS33]QHE86257.1 hypothetical protein F9K07_15770 [Hydrogenophaga sp. BPS33]
MRRQSAPSRTTLLALLLGTVLVPALAAPDHFDIVGLRLGMTEQQVRSTLNAHNPQLQLNSKTVSYTYSDGTKQHQTAPALAEIVAVAMNGTENITLLFSQPPKPARLVGVRRVASLPNPPTHEQMVQATLQKYGPPAVNRPRERLKPETRLIWIEPGKPQCWRSSAKQVAVFTAASPVLDVLQQFAQRQKMGFAPADLSQCGAIAQFVTASDPVRNFTMEMTDTGPWLDTLQATRAWVSGLEAQAKKARVGAGTTPKL